jgi:hypothetical protein
MCFFCIFFSHRLSFDFKDVWFIISPSCCACAVGLHASNDVTDIGARSFALHTPLLNMNDKSTRKRVEDTHDEEHAKTRELIWQLMRQQNPF